jgi:Rod binding domain-containing protein
MALSPISLSPNLLRPVAAAPSLGQARSADPETMARIRKTAQDFEASYLSNALSYMFDGIKASAPFGGGEGEAAFKSFLTDAYAKQIIKAGGIGLGGAIQKEILTLQGLTAQARP